MSDTGSSPSEYIPRSFKLRMELECYEKGFGQNPEGKRALERISSHQPFITMGLGTFKEENFDKKETYHTQLSMWDASIIGPQNTNLGERIYQVKVIAGPHYPHKAPQIRFINKINMDCVGPTGVVDYSKTKMRWNPHMMMIECLAHVRELMLPASRLQQPSPSATY